MSEPAMPSPARIVSKSMALITAKGYSRQQAARIIMDVTESIGAQKDHLRPWMTDWLRGVWSAANKIHQTYEGQETNGHE